MRVLLRPAFWSLLIAAAMSPAAHAAWNWPWNDSAKARHAGRTVHANVQHPVRPLGNAGQRPVKPIVGTRPIGKTILAKRPP
jgi:hypothetical protein